MQFMTVSIAQAAAIAIVITITIIIVTAAVMSAYAAIVTGNADALTETAEILSGPIFLIPAPFPALSFTAVQNKHKSLSAERLLIFFYQMLRERFLKCRSFLSLKFF